MSDQSNQPARQWTGVRYIKYEYESDGKAYSATTFEKELGHVIEYSAFEQLQRELNAMLMNRNHYCDVYQKAVKERDELLNENKKLREEYLSLIKDL